MDKKLIDERIASFKERAEEMGLVHGFDYKMEPREEYGDFIIKSTKAKDGLIVFYALMGLATHFEDRSWATDRTWTFIIKSQFGLRFTDKPTDS